MISTVQLTSHVRIASRSTPAICQVLSCASGANSRTLRSEPLGLAHTRRSFRTALSMTRAGDDHPPSLTSVPKSKTDEEAATGALALSHDCAAAYGQAAEKAKDAELKQALEKFAGQAENWIDQWRGLLDPPPDKETGISTALNAGKVQLAQIAGDKAIVKAIYNNSNDSYTAFSEVSKRSDFSSRTTGLAKKLAPEAEAARSFFDKWQAAQS